ncbi:MAG: hypothetical protein A4E58_01578 [Syntrophorhabdus sp. PtaB.Bin006]|nr:MAG: hypothetical protein A4E58_01578 [Syntrophorhabdus sp. PtaB.Bin006]
MKPKQLLFCGTAHPCKSSFVAVNIPLTIEYDDGVNRLFKNSPKRLLAFLKVLPGLFALGNVSDKSPQFVWLAIPVRDSIRANFYRNDSAVLSYVFLLIDIRIAPL